MYAEKHQLRDARLCVLHCTMLHMCALSCINYWHTSCEPHPLFSFPSCVPGFCVAITSGCPQPSFDDDNHTSYHYGHTRNDILL